MNILFISPGAASEVYQDLSKSQSAIEPPTWALLLAESCRAIGITCDLLDVNASRIDNQEAARIVYEADPDLICFVVYGQNVNAGTTQMTGAVRLANTMRRQWGIKIPIAFIGSYVQALPKKALQDESSIDFVFTNEGVYALREYFCRNGSLKHLKDIRGIAWRDGENIVINQPSELVPSEALAMDLPGYAWDLLPSWKRYRASLWHSGFNESNRSPYAAIYTSLGCIYGCGFCMINVLNRNNTDEIGISSDYRRMRFWPPDFVVDQIRKLAEQGVTTIRITDEMFLLKRSHYLAICEGIKSLGLGDKLNMWAYSRVDTVANPETLKLLRGAGFRGLCLGIESADRKVRLEIDKGRFREVDVKRVIEQIHDAGIEVLANYIFGLPGDTMATMQRTLDLSLELCTSGWNAYAAMALPGSRLYADAIKHDIKVPEAYSGYSFHSYDCLPLPTEELTPGQILKFRDDAFHQYHSNPAFLARIERIYGSEAVKKVQEMNSVRLKRAICV